ncbi:MAG: glycoside hydrolase family 97 protein, partial [Bacteroidetes bacterium]
DALEYGYLINFHGATLPRGWHRTYPNLMTMESVKGEEFITFVQENADLAPAHCTVLPFARNAFDPMDFTPMVLDSIPNIEKRTSAAFDLALPVLFLSGIQHIAEIPEGMAKMPDYVVDYLRDIPVDWDDSKFIDGLPGKFIIMARQKGTTWHIVGINAEETPGTYQLDLSFIGEGQGLLITDAEEGYFMSRQVTLQPEEFLEIKMKARGGFVLKVQ